MFGPLRSIQFHISERAYGEWSASKRWHCVLGACSMGDLAGLVHQGVLLVDMD